MKKAKKSDYWRDVLKQWQASGLPQRQFCLRHSIDGNKFSRWKHVFKKLEQQHQGQPSSPTAEAYLKAIAVSDSATQSTPAFIPIKIKQNSNPDTKIILQLGKHAKIEANIKLTQQHLLDLFKIMEVAL